MKALFSIGLYLAYFVLTLIIFYLNGTCIWESFPDKIVILRVIFIPAFLLAITWLNIWLFSKKIFKGNRKIVIICLAILIISGFITGSVDYHRVTKNKKPIFVIMEPNRNGPEIAYYGLNYKIVRRPILSYKDNLKHDVYVKFGFWFHTWQVDRSKS